MSERGVEAASADRGSDIGITLDIGSFSEVAWHVRMARHDGAKPPFRLPILQPVLPAGADVSRFNRGRHVRIQRQIESLVEGVGSGLRLALMNKSLQRKREQAGVSELHVGRPAACEQLRLGRFGGGEIAAQVLHLVREPGQLGEVRGARADGRQHARDPSGLQKLAGYRNRRRNRAHARRRSEASQ